MEYLIDVKATDEVKHYQEKVYKIEFKSHEDYARFLSEPFKFLETRESQKQVILSVHDRQINTLFGRLQAYDIEFITEMKFTLEKYF